MKKSELRKLIADYKEVKKKLEKSNDSKLKEKLEIIEMGIIMRQVKY